MRPYSKKKWTFEISGFPTPIDRKRVGDELAPKIQQLIDEFGVEPDFKWNGHVDDNRPRILLPSSLSEDLREQLKSTFRDVIGFHCVFPGSND